MHIRTYLINWPKTTVPALSMAKELAPCTDSLFVLDGDMRRPFWKTPYVNLCIPDEYRFGQQFHIIVDHFLHEEGDILGIVMGDAIVRNTTMFPHAMETIFKNVRAVFDTTDAWMCSPLIADCCWNSRTLDWYEAPENMKGVACTDELFFFMHRDLVETYVNHYIQDAFKENRFGWGIDLVLCGLSWLSHKPVLRFDDLFIGHAGGSGYSYEKANEEMHESLANLGGSLEKYARFTLTNRMDSLHLLLKGDV